MAQPISSENRAPAHKPNGNSSSQHKASSKKQELYNLANEAEVLVAQIVQYYLSNDVQNDQHRAVVINDNHHWVVNPDDNNWMGFTIGWAFDVENRDKQRVTTKGVLFPHEIEGKTVFLPISFEDAKLQLKKIIAAAEHISGELGIKTLPRR